MNQPIFWLGLSLFLVAVSLTAVLMAAFPAFRELARAARSAEKLFDTLSRELPPTLEAIKLTGGEITELTEDISGGIGHASHLVEQVDQSVTTVKRQVKETQITTRSLWAGTRAAWRSLFKPSRRKKSAKIKTYRKSRTPHYLPTETHANQAETPQMNRHDLP